MTKPTETQKTPMGPRFGAGQPVEKAKDFKGTIKKLAYYLKPDWIRIVVVMVFAIVSTVFAIVSPKLLGNATNTLVDDFIKVTVYNQVHSKLPEGTILPAGTTGADLLKMMPAEAISKISSDKLEVIKSLDMTVAPAISFDKIAVIIWWLLALYVLSAAFNYLQGWVMVTVTQKVVHRLRKNISEKINRLPLSYFDKKTYGEVLSRITNDVDTVGQTLNQSLSQIVSSVVMLIGIAAMMISISWLLTIVAIIVLPLSFGLIGLIMKRSQTQFKKQQETLGELNGHIEEMYSGHVVMRVFNGEKRSVDKFNRINKQLYVSAWKSQFLSGMMMPIMSFIGNLGYVGVAVVGGWLAVQGKIKIGDIQAFIQYVQQFNQPIRQTANIANIMQSTAAAAERVFDFLDEKEELPDSEKSLALRDVSGAVNFEDVSFGYDPDKMIIKHLSAKIRPGHRIAIVGPTGAGKTTLVNLLMRFYEVNSGQITIDGTDIRDIKRADVRKMFGMVLQDTWLFSGTIRENLMYGNPNATEEEMIAAAKDAYVDRFVRSLPGGYDMMINEEASNISRGEKQLLTIARAMLAHTPMLILDEATSSVDTRTEVLIQEAMDNLMKDKTSFVIAHRLSTIRNADLILVMNNGNIVEQGNHDELMEANGFYASLYNSQFVAEEE